MLRSGLKQAVLAIMVWLTGATVVSMPAAAQDAALSLLPQDQPARAPWSLFSTRMAPDPAPPRQDEAAPAEATGEKQAPAASPAASPPASDRKGWKLVKVPLPPIPDRPRSTAKGSTSQGATARAGASPPETADQARADIDAAAQIPPQPKPTGLFALLFTNQPPAGPAADGASLPDAAPATEAVPASVPAQGDRGRKADLTDPFRPRNLPGPAEAEDDLDLEETQAGVIKQVSHVAIACLKPQLLEMIRQAGEHFGAMPIITSGQRGSGRRGSLHRSCEAADFVIPGVETHVLAAYLRKMPGAGGVGTYCHTKSVHLDTGEPRDWRYCGFSRRFALRTPVVAENGSR